MRESDALGVRFEVASSQAEVEVFLSDLIRLHSQRWRSVGERGTFAAPRFIDFHRAIAAQMVPNGQVFIARLCEGARVVAVIYGFITGAKFEFYQSGVDTGPAAQLKRPGILAHLLSMRYLSARGIANYDFLAGEAPYKLSLSTSQTRLARLQLRRPGLRGLLGVAQEKVTVLFKKVLAKLTRPQAISNVRTLSVKGADL